MEVNPWNSIRKHIYVLSILAIGILVFFNALFGVPLWDDIGYIFKNPQLQSLNLPLLFGNNLINGTGFYRPIAVLYFAVMLLLFHHHSFPLHFFQISLHIINAFLVFTFLKKIFSRGVSFVGALFFLVHPIIVESVVYISTIDDPLFFFFGIVSLIVIQNLKTTKDVFFLMGIFLLMLLTKETGILFLFLGILYMLFFKKRKIVSVLLGEGIILGIYIVIRYLFVGFTSMQSNVIPIATAPLLERMYSMPLIFFYYIKTFFSPLSLAIDQQWIVTSPSFRYFFLPLMIDSLFILCILIGTYFLHKHFREKVKTYLFFCGWFFIGMAMHMQIIPLDMTVADRWFYAPLVGMIGMGVTLYAVIERGKPYIKKWLLTACVISISLLALRTMIRNTNWVDSLTLYSHDIKYTDSAELEANLAADLVDAKSYDLALVYGKKSVALLPVDYNTYDLGAIYEIKNDFSHAKRYYYQALSAKSHPIPGHKHIKVIYEGVGEFASMHDTPQTARMILMEGISDYPDDPILWTYLSVIQYEMDNQQKAEESILKAYKLAKTENTIYVKYQIEHHLPIVVSDKHGMSQTITPGQLR